MSAFLRPPSGRRIVRLVTLVVVLLGLAGLSVIGILGWRDTEIRRALSPVVRWLPVARAAQARASIPPSLNGRLRLRVLRTTSFPDTGGGEIPQYVVGDFLGDGSTTVYQEFIPGGRASLGTLEGRELAVFPRPVLLTNTWEDMFLGPRLAVLPRAGGDLLLRVEGTTSTLEAVSLPDGRPVWQFALSRSANQPRGHLGTLTDADGRAMVWYADAGAGRLTFLDAEGVPVREEVFLTGTLFFTGDYDGDGVEDLLALHPEEDSRLFDASGTETARIRFALPPGELLVSALPARGADGSPQFRLDFNSRSPLFHTADGLLAEAPADAPTTSDWRPFLRAGDTLAMGDGRRLMVTMPQITLLGPDGRTQDVLNGDDMAFMPVGRDVQGRPLVAVFDGSMGAALMYLVAVTAE